MRRTKNPVLCYKSFCRSSADGMVQCARASLVCVFMTNTNNSSFLYIVGSFDSRKNKARQKTSPFLRIRRERTIIANISLYGFSLYRFTAQRVQQIVQQSLQTLLCVCLRVRAGSLRDKPRPGRTHCSRGKAGRNSNLKA